jgi:hypothetical protein
MKSEFHELTREEMFKLYKDGADAIRNKVEDKPTPGDLAFRDCQRINNQYTLFVFDHPEWFIDEVEDECESFFDIISRCLTKYFESKLGINPVVEL